MGQTPVPLSFKLGIVELYTWNQDVVVMPTRDYSALCVLSGLHLPLPTKYLVEAESPTWRTAGNALGALRLLRQMPFSLSCQRPISLPRVGGVNETCPGDKGTAQFQSPKTLRIGPKVAAAWPNSRPNGRHHCA